ncbi:MAG TPA: hypothetical protein VMT32_06415 [Bryobacteraceae bacterium]|nr:hypothetical protein [Bryobacteraceae bacterium]
MTILTGDAQAVQLRPGVQRAIAASADDAALAVEMELISVLEGPAFHGSARSRAFLRFVVEESLAGRHDLLKERTVGAAVLGKPSDYDTGADSTVRVRANEVRKRLAVHYHSVAPKAGIRIELPLGTYAPKFCAVAPPPAPVSLALVQPPPPMLLWQLAAPTLVAIFLALVAFRGGVESTDAFSRFWNQAMAGKTEIAVVIDSDTDTSISPAMADAAMPIATLAETLQVPVRIVAADAGHIPGAYVVRLSLNKWLSGRTLLHLGHASLIRETTGEQSLWLCADTPDELRTAAQMLTSHSAFPSIE